MALSQRTQEGDEELADEHADLGGIDMDSDDGQEEMIRKTPLQIIAEGTDWRFLKELKKEMKG